jgi:hypothetical protein
MIVVGAVLAFAATVGPKHQAPKEESVGLDQTDVALAEEADLQADRLGATLKQAFKFVGEPFKGGGPIDEQALADGARLSTFLNKFGGRSRLVNKQDRPASISLARANDRWLMVVPTANDADKVLVVDGGESAVWTHRNDLADRVGEWVTLEPAKDTSPRASAWISDAQANLGLFRTPRESRRVDVFNPSDKPIEVEKLSFSCPCATCGAGPTTIPPRGHSPFRIDFDLDGKARVFSVKMLVKVKAEAPLVVELHGSQGRAIGFQPSVVAFGDISPETARAAATVRYVNHVEPVTSLRPVYIDRGVLLGGVRKSANGIFEIDLAVDVIEAAMNTADGRFQLKAIFAIDDEPLMPKVAEVTLNGRRAPWMEVWPTVAYFGKVPAGSEQSTVIRVAKHGAGPIIASTRSPGLASSVVEQQDRVRISVKVPHRLGPFQTSLLLRCGEHCLTVPIRGEGVAASPSGRLTTAALLTP